MCVIYAARVQLNCMIVTAAFFPELIAFIVTYTDTMHGMRMKVYQQSTDHISIPIVVMVLHITECPASAIQKHCSQQIVQ